MATLTTLESADVNLEKLLEEAEQGDVFVIQRQGREVARITVTAKPHSNGGKRDIQFGWAKDLIHFSEDFDDPLPWDEWLNDPDDPLNSIPDRTA